MQKNKKGFSLVELSIVLVILGLLVGGIMTGQNLIRAAELRSVTTEFQKIQTAVNLFREKYFALPGDMRNATQFWDAATNCTATGGVKLSGGTCNGGGDGIISQRESFYAWHHLAQAGFITGEYSGLSGPADNNRDAVSGFNVLQAKLRSDAGWCMFYGGGGYEFNLDYSKVFTIGSTADNNQFCADHNIFVLKPEESWGIDTKIDDGMPAQGKVIAHETLACTDAATDMTKYDAVYSLSNDNVVCNLIFLQAY